MTTGLLAARIIQTLDGHLGHPGWRWMYIITAVITLPVAAYGFIFFPGAPSTGKRWYFTDEEYELAKERMRLVGRKEPQGLNFSLRTIKRFLGRWHFWILIPWNILWLLGYMSTGQGACTLWLKSNKQYSTPEVNNLTVGYPHIWTVSTLGRKSGRGHCLHLLFRLAGRQIQQQGWGLVHRSLLDRHVHRLPCVRAVRQVFVLLEMVCLGFRLPGHHSHSPRFAVATGYMEVSLSPVVYSWANLICAGDAEERAFVVSSMLAIGTAFNVWVPLLTFKTVDAPRFHKGFLTQLILQPVYFFWTLGVYFVTRRQSRKKGGRVRKRRPLKFESNTKVGRAKIGAPDFLRMS